MLHRAEALAEEIGDDKKRIQIRSILGAYFIFRGRDPKLGWKYLESCMEHPETIQDVELMVPVGFDLCVSCITSGNCRRVNHSCAHDHRPD